VVHGIAQADLTHFVEHPLDALTEFLPDAQIGAHSGNARIPRKSADLQRLLGISQSGKATRTLYLDAVGVDLDSYVIAGQAVRSVHDRIDQTFEPCVPGNNRSGPEPTGLVQGASPRDKLLDGRIRSFYGERYRSLDSMIGGFIQSQTCSSSTFDRQEPKYADVRLGKDVLWMSAEQKIPRIRHIAVTGQQASRSEDSVVGRRASGVAIPGQKPLIEIGELDSGRCLTVVLALPLVELKFATLCVSKLS